jgi:acyl-homoserine-lactone acylase
MRIQKEESAIPWVNTVAAGRGSGQVWYADIGAVPNVPPAQLQACATPASAAINAALPQVPVLAGGSSQCDWSSDADSVQAGAIGPARMPSLLRSDYVGNMNDSYWLSNASAPLTGYPAIFGSTSSAQSLRTRMGHTMALQRLAGTDGYPGRLATSDIVRQMVLDSRIYSARFKDEALAQVCGGPVFSAGGETVDVSAACTALQAWDGTGTAASRGSHVWDEFWKRVASQIKPADLYAVPFDAADPVNTPRGIKPAAKAALQKAFAEAVKAVQASGFAMDAARGTVLFSQRGGEKIALYGGCGEVGYFTITFSLSDDPASAHYVDYTKAYGARQWLKLPFTDSAIQASPAYKTQTVNE